MSRIGTQAPDFFLKDPNGKIAKLSSFKREKDITFVPVAGLDLNLS